MFYTDQIAVPNASSVELTAGFDTDQEYEIRVTASGAYLGADSAVDASNGYHLSASEVVLRLQGEKVWAYGPGAGIVATVLAFSV